MASPAPPPNALTRLGDRLAANRRRHVVGRAPERALFGEALAAAEPPFALLFLHGPGGIGKSTLLAEFARLAAEAGRRVVALDGHGLEPTPPGFLGGLRRALGLGEAESPLETFAREPGAVLLVDTFEVLRPIEAWLRETLLPQLPAATIVVVAGRTPPSAAWRADPSWHDLLRVVALRNLRPEESRAYLEARGVAADHHAAALAFTHGHPLALALVADLLTQASYPAPFQPEQEPDVVRALLDRFVRDAPSPRHRQALAVCAHARVTTESLLAETLGPEEADALFAWLGDLSFVERRPDGLAPHDLAREVLDADRRWRDPEGYRRLHAALRRPIVRRIQEERGVAQQQALFDLLHLHRTSPAIRPIQDWETLGGTYAEPATAADLPAILGMVRRHEGEESARIAAHWFARQPVAFVLCRGADREPAGFVATLDLHRAVPEDLAVDPGAAAAAGFARRHAPPRSGEELIHHRFAMGRETYQTASATTNLMAATCSKHWLTRPKLAWSFLAVADPDYWRAPFAHLNLRRTPEADFAVGGRRYAVYGHDWRAEPALAWLELMGERELATEPPVATAEPDLPPPLIVLSRPEFDAAVRQALRDYARSDRLEANPLLRSRLLADRGGAGDPEALRGVLREASAMVAASPRDEKFSRAVARTYLDPAPSQEAAAERLGLPFSTYRYQLAGGIARIAEWLWRREVGPLEG